MRGPQGTPPAELTAERDPALLFLQNARAARVPSPVLRDALPGTAASCSLWWPILPMGVFKGRTSMA